MQYMIGISQCTINLVVVLGYVSVASSNTDDTGFVQWEGGMDGEKFDRKTNIMAV